MAQAFDSKTGQLVEVPDAPAGGTVSVVAPTGETQQVDASKAQSLLQLGFKLDTPELRAENARQEKYGTGLGQVASGLLGGARGLSFGISDLVLSKTGALSPEQLRNFSEVNPDATLGGELGSIVVGPLGAAGLAAKGAKALGAGATAVRAAEGVDAALRIAGAPMGAVSKAGGALGGLVGKVAGETLGTAAHMAAEAEAYSIAHNLSEDVLGDKDVTAERLLAHSGEALALGGGLGLALPLAGVIAGKVAGKAKNAADVLGATLRDKVLPTLGDAAAKGYAKGFEALTGQEAGKVEGLLTGTFQPEAAAARKELIDTISPEARNQLHQELFSGLEAAHTEAEGALRHLYRDVRQKEVSTLLDGVEAAPAVNDIARLSDGIKERVVKMANDPLLYDQAYARELAKVTEDIDAKLAAGDIASAEQAFHSVNTLKGNTLTDLAGYKKNWEMLSRGEQNALKEVRGIYDDFAKHLENPEIYGEAAARQQAVNEAVSNFKKITGKDSDFRRLFMAKSGKSYVINSEKVNKFLNRTGAARDVEMQAALTDFQQAARAIGDQTEKSAATAKVAGFDKAGLESLLTKVGEKQAQSIKQLATVSQVRAQDAFGMAFSRFQNQASQVPLGGTISAVLKLAEKASNPFSVMKGLSAVEGFALKTSKRISSAADKFATAASKQAKNVAKIARPFEAPASVHVLRDSRVMSARADRNDDDKNRGFQSQYTKVAELAADPVTASTKLHDGYAKLHGSAPQLVETLVQKQIAAATFLYDKAPKNPSAGKTLNPLIEKWKPSDAAIATWERYVAAVQDPLSVLADLEHGRCSREGVEALQSVYPALYSDVQKSFVSKLSELQVQMPYKQRLNLSILLGIPVDPSTDPQFVAAMQATHGQAIAQEQQQKVRASADVDLSSSSQTQTERVANR